MDNQRLNPFENLNIGNFKNYHQSVNDAVDKVILDLSKHSDKKYFDFKECEELGKHASITLKRQDD